MGLESGVMETSIMQTVRDHLAASKYRWPEVSKESGVSYTTLKRIASDEDANPTVAQVEKLLAYFARVKSNS